MKLAAGDVAPSINLPQVEGAPFDTSILKNKAYLLSFYRFATCPFCNLRVHELIRRKEELGPAFEIIGVFESPRSHLQHHMQSHDLNFPILSDPANVAYRLYGIEHSFGGMLKGMIFRLPTLLKGIMKGYVPCVMKGNVTKMPADFLINDKGEVVKAYYAKDEGDHLPFDEIKQFALANQ